LQNYLIKKNKVKYLATLFLFAISLNSFSQRNIDKLESSFDFGFGNHFGFRQIESGYKVKALTLSNYTLGWTNYFTNNKFGGRLELSYDKILNNPGSNPFETDYFRLTYYLNASLKNIAGWGASNKVSGKRTFWQAFDVDLGIGLGYSAMKSSAYPVNETPFLPKADDMLNISFRVAPRIEISHNFKLFLSYTHINHSAQSATFDSSSLIDNTAFKGGFRTVNFGLCYTPHGRRVCDRALKIAHKKLHFFTSIDASIGNHFAGKTQMESAKFKVGAIGHLNIGANHRFPNSRLYGRFDLGFDAFKESKNEQTYTSKYFRTTYQIIANMRALGGLKKNTSKWNLAFGAGLGFATMYNTESSNKMSDIFLKGDDMYALVFSVNPSYRISKDFSVIANATATSHSLQSLTWDMQNSQINSALNGRFMNMSLGIRFHLARKKRIN
jgi:hypothetical protein